MPFRHIAQDPELSEKTPRKPKFYILHGARVREELFFSLGMSDYGYIRAPAKEIGSVNSEYTDNFQLCIFTSLRTM